MADLARKSGRMTGDAFIRWQETQETKYELWDGVPVPKHAAVEMMAGGSVKHGIIAANIVRRLAEQLDGRPCVPFGDNLKVKIDDKGNYRLPDAGVDCGIGEDDDLENKYVYAQPTLLVEIISRSTEVVDWDRKLSEYKTLPSMLYILLVEQRRPMAVLHFRDEDGAWRRQEHIGLESVIELPKIDVKLSLSAMYYRVTFKT